MTLTSSLQPAKYVIPPLPPVYVDRPRLAAALDIATTSKPTVVVCGAGWGKTTAVAAWAARHRACWLTLDVADPSLEGFASDILRALRRRAPGLPAKLTTATAGAGLEARVEATVALLPGLLDTHLDQELVLVLDGIPELPPRSGVARLLEELCRPIAPALRLVLLTRHALPFLSSANGPRAAVEEIDAQALAFDANEVAALLESTVAEAGPELAQTVLSATSGWPAAVRICAEALRARQRVPHQTTQKQLGHRSIRTLTKLAEDVVDSQPEAVRRLLHLVAVLERVTAPLCTALGHPEAEAALAELTQRGLLVVDGADEPSWSVVEPIRALMAGRADQDPPRRRALHQQAARFHDRRGACTEALRHLVAARDRDAVIRFLMERDEQVIAEGGLAAILAAANSLWTDGGEQQSHHGLPLVLGYARQLSGDSDGSRAWESELGGDDPLEPRVAWRVGALHHLAGRFDKAVAAYRRAGLGELATPDEARLLCMAAGWLRDVGACEEASRLASRGLEAAQRCGDSSAVAWGHRAEALLSAHDGDRASASMHYRQALSFAQRAGHRLLQLMIWVERAWFEVEDGSPTEALEKVQHALRLVGEHGFAAYEPLCLSIRARANAKLGRLDKALSDLKAGQDLWDSMGPSFGTTYGLIVCGDVHRRRGESGQAQAALEEALSRMSGVQAHPLHALAHATLARVRAADNLVAARDLAERAVAAGRGVSQVQALLARGWIALLAGDRRAARADAAKARSLAGARRDQGGLAEALELAALAAGDWKTAKALLEEAGALWQELEDPIGQARIRLAVSRLGGPPTGSTADLTEPDEELSRRGVRYESGMADMLGALQPRVTSVAIQTLGNFRVLRDGVVVPTGEWQSKKARDLLKILVAHRGRPVPRPRLMELLWPDEPPERTANRLSVLLSTLRTVLDPERRLAEPGPVVADRITVLLDLSVVSVDVERFLAGVEQAQQAHRHADPEARALLVAAESLYQGEFLAEDPYEEWTVPLREELRAAYAAVLWALVSCPGGDDLTVRYLLRLLDQDPFDESAHLELVRVLRAAGRHGEARRRHRIYSERMREIGLNPVPLPVEHAGHSQSVPLWGAGWGSGSGRSRLPGWLGKS